MEPPCWRGWLRMASDFLNIILCICTLALVIYSAFVLYKFHEVTKEADRMLKEIQEETEDEQ